MNLKIFDMQISSLLKRKKCPAFERKWDDVDKIGSSPSSVIDILSSV